MKLKVISDLHFEFMRDGGKSFMKSFSNQDVDVLVLAGDTIPLCQPYVKEAFQRVCDKFSTVVVVLGNHEFYGSDPVTTLKRMSDIESSISNLHWLRIDNPFVKDGQRIIGDTMWFKDDPDNAYCCRGMMDFHVISQFAPWVYGANEEQVNWLWENCTENDIVVTHHIPSSHCVHPRYINSPLNKFFVCDMDEMMLDKKPKLWLAGHTHVKYMGMVYFTKVVINPLGYPDERTECNKHLVIDI